MKEKLNSPPAKKYKQPPILKLEEGLNDLLKATFFLIVNPGMEKLALREVEDVLRGTEIFPTVGGIQFNSTWGTVRLGQPKLKTASRLLVRIDQFGARDFQKLFRKVSGLPWNKWLQPGTAISVRASSQTSRLRIKKGIERTVVEAFEKATAQPKQKQSNKDQDLLCLVRMEDDLCTISLDLSGDLLHKRGDREDVGRAPLRETWAAAILAKADQLIRGDHELEALFSKPWQWIEPMAGTAVFLKEALAAEGSANASHDAVEAGASPLRQFAIDTCYLVQPVSSVSNTKVSEAASKIETPKRDLPPKAVFSFIPACTNAWVIDLDADQLARAEKALKDVTVNVPNLKINFLPKPPTKAELHSEDSAEARFVVLNPPWGVRLKGPSATDSPKNQSELLNSVMNLYLPHFAVILLPEKGSEGARLPKGWVELEGISFRAGGIPVKARFFKISH